MGTKLPDKPLLTPPALAFLEGILTPESCVFEWGSGGSTVWLAGLVGELVSVEHNKNWFRLVNEALKADGLDARLWRLPPHRITEPMQTYPDNYWDVVLVDGLDSERCDCVEVARRKVRDGGWLMLDDSQWRKLRPAVRMMRGWRRQDERGRMRWGPHPGRKKMATFWQKGGGR